MEVTSSTLFPTLCVHQVVEWWDRNMKVEKFEVEVLRCSKDFTYSWVCSVETSKPGGIKTMSSQFDVVLSCNFARETDSAKPVILKEKRITERLWCFFFDCLPSFPWQYLRKLQPLEYKIMHFNMRWRKLWIYKKMGRLKLKKTWISPGFRAGLSRFCWLDARIRDFSKSSCQNSTKIQACRSCNQCMDKGELGLVSLTNLSEENRAITHVFTS